MTQTITLSFSLTLEVPDGVTVAGIAPTATVRAPPPAPLAVVPTGPALPRGKAPGKLQRSLLEALASRHGRLSDPAGRTLGRIVKLAGAASPNSASACLKTLDDQGLIERQIQAKRCYRITLTPAGWAAIDRTPPTSQDIDTAPARAPKQAATMPELGPIERRPFDPDEVRAQQADALIDSGTG